MCKQIQTEIAEKQGEHEPQSRNANNERATEPSGPRRALRGSFGDTICLLNHDAQVRVICTVKSSVSYLNCNVSLDLDCIYMCWSAGARAGARAKARAGVRARAKSGARVKAKARGRAQAIGRARVSAGARAIDAAGAGAGAGARAGARATSFTSDSRDKNTPANDKNTF